MSFGSDNHSGVHPKILESLSFCNDGYQSSYGADKQTAIFESKMKEIFGPQSNSFIVFTGTGANVLSIKATCSSFHSVICTDIAHLACDESGAPENYAGCKVIPIPHRNGKITVDQIKSKLDRRGDIHSSQPRLISITQCTEVGTVYTPQEIEAIATFAHDNQLLLHMDGARISNAAVALNCSWASISRDCGVDILSLGGTKNGMLMGEAVVIMNQNLAPEMPWIRKQAMQLASKMRYISCQFNTYLEDELWRQNGQNANAMASYLAEEAGTVKGIDIVYPVEANEVFAKVPHKVIKNLSDKWKFYVWEEDQNIVRWVTSWETQRETVDSFLSDLRTTCSLLK